jgi:hypothetical protein
MTPKQVEWKKYLEQQEAIRQAQSVPTVSVNLGCTGHGQVGYIHSYAVEEPIYGQISRRMVSGLSCGGTIAAGYSLPRTWTPGMKVKVRWSRPIKGEDNWLEKTTTIPRYEQVGDLYVHFYPNDEVRVVVSRVGTENPDHPLQRSVTVPPPEPQ